MAKTAPPIVDMDYSIHYRNWHNESPEHVREMVDLFRGIYRPGSRSSRRDRSWT